MSLETYTSGETLKQMRMKTDWRAADVARCAECTSSTINNIENNGRCPSPKVLAAYALLLDLTVEQVSQIQADAYYLTLLDRAGEFKKKLKIPKQKTWGKKDVG